MLTGEIGCGKTLTRAVFADRLEQRRFVVVTQENSSFSFTELLGLVLQDLDGEPPDAGKTKYARYERFKKAVERLSLEGRHLVLIFDEAQGMSPATLNELKQLTNLNRAGRSYLTVILVGQPELRDLVTKLPAINQRISLRFHVNPLNLDECAGYFQHRLKVAGHPTGELFQPDAVELAFQTSLGVPRELNRIAKLALEFGWVKGHRDVKLDAVDAVVRDLKRQQRLSRS
jgi:general secretion pathway protein A